MDWEKARKRDVKRLQVATNELPSVKKKPRIPLSRRLLPAKYTTTCFECQNTILPGESIYMLRVGRWMDRCRHCGPWSPTWEEDNT